MYQTGISSYTEPQLAELVKEMGQPAFRAKQLFKWLHEKQARSFSEMTDQPKAFLAALEERFFIETLETERRQQSKDGTVKYLFRLPDGNCIETVLMRYSYGNTVCVSTQVGCRMGCRFCASTQGGRVRNLTAGEIANEVYAAARDTGERVSHIVLMGIGEPLDNFDHVMDFLSIISSPNGVNIGMRNISLSTCGLVPMIYKLAERHLGLTLSVSLHAPTDEMRSSMMPVNDVYPVEQLIRACRDYQQETGRRVSFEYSMVNGVNDSPQTARRLAQLIKGMGAHVNLIPINPVDGSPYSATDAANVKRFQTLLTELGVNATVRRRLGTDISAACGQLRREAKGGTTRMKLVAKTDIGSQRSENQDSYRGGRRRTTLFGVPCATVWAVRAAAAWPAPWRWMRCSRPSRRVLTRRTPRRPDAHCWKAPWSRPTAAFMKRRGARLRSAAWAPLLYARWCAEALRSMCMWAIPAFICFATTSCFSLQKTIPWCRRWWSRAR